MDPFGGRREKFTRSQLERARKLIDASEPTTHAARDLGTSRATIYHRVNQLGSDVTPVSA